jgi:hypothetical protein
LPTICSYTRGALTVAGMVRVTVVSNGAEVKPPCAWEISATEALRPGIEPTRAAAAWASSLGPEREPGPADPGAPSSRPTGVTVNLMAGHRRRHVTM